MFEARLERHPRTVFQRDAGSARYQMGSGCLNHTIEARQGHAQTWEILSGNYLLAMWWFSEKYWSKWESSPNNERENI